LSFFYLAALQDAPADLDTFIDICRGVSLFFQPRYRMPVLIYIANGLNKYMAIDREDAWSIVTAGATANTMVGTVARLGIGLLCSDSHGESIVI